MTEQTPEPGPGRIGPQELGAWLTSRVAAIAGVGSAEIDPAAQFQRYAIGSIDAVGISGDLSELLGRRLDPALLYQHPTIEDVVAHLCAAPAEQSAPAPAPAAPPLVRSAAEDARDPVVLVGLDCRFPGGAHGPERFWRNLVDGLDAASDVPGERWDARALLAEDPDAPGAVYTARGGFVEDLAGFDPAVFGISPREALRMDPQQRMLLETAWHALEHAGIAPDRLRGSRTGVFVGMMPGTHYAKLQQERTGPSVLDDPYLGLGVSSSVVAGRLSYLLDLRGPSVLLDTACSSSLVALHLAVRSLRAGESDLALVGGVSAILHKDVYIQACRMRMLARDGRCKTFDAAADGFLLGEGCGVVVLERLSDAVARGHRALAVVRGTAVNQDGASNGLTAPNGAAQVAVIREALADAGIAPSAVDYVEAHGSGTALGDGIEMDSLHTVFGRDREQGRPLVVGAVKTNIGHLTGAAGMAGLIKAVLALGHGRIPGNLHYREPNPAIDFERCPTLLPDRPVEWPHDPRRPRVAGVSSFGWSGTNGHVVLEAPPQPAARAPRPADWHVLPVAAHTEQALRATVAALEERVLAEPETPLEDLAATLHRGRSALRHRIAVPADGVAPGLAALKQRLSGDTGPVAPGVAGRTALLLPGTGELRRGTARAFYDADPDYRAAFDACADAAAGLLGLDLRAELYPEQDPGAEAAPAPGLFASRQAPTGALAERLDVAHAAVFAVDYACAQMWRARGLRPSALLGYSLGEYVAACLAGVFALDDALALVIRRARLVAESAPGAMTTVAAGPDEVAAALPPGASIAVYNGPMTTVAAGTPEAIAQLEGRLRTQGVAVMRIPGATRAMHSPVLAPIAQQLAALVAEVPRNAPHTRFVSNLTGDWITPEQAVDPGYWARHLCSTVRFADGVATLADACAVLVESGPGQLASLAIQNLLGRDTARPPVAVPTLPGATDPRPCAAVLAGSLARLWEVGVPLDLGAPGSAGRIVTLPGYPFEHQHLWPQPLPGADTVPVAAPRALAPAPNAASAEPRPEPAAEHSSPPLLYAPVWEPAEAADGRVVGPVLVYADTAGLAERLAARLGASGPVTLAVPGPRYERTGAGRFAVRAEETEDHARLLRELGDAAPRSVVWLWPVESDGPGDSFGAALAMTRALAQASLDGVRVLLVTHAAQAAVPGDRAEPRQALLHGLALTAPQEYSGWAWREADIDLAATGPDEAADALAAELGWPGEDGVLAWRRGRRLALRHRPAAAPVAAPCAIRDHGTYLITGAFGTVGRLLAGHLAASASDVGLVLTARTELPPREQWEALVCEGGSAIVERIETVRALESAGARVMVGAADVADPDAMRALLDRARERFGPLTGVIHAAGDTSRQGFAPLAQTSPELLARHLDAKVSGTLVLDDLLTGQPTDFRLLMSSTSAVLGGLGFTAYAAANAFLDRFAELRPGGEGDRTGWQSISWDTWQSTRTGAEPGLGASLRTYSFTPEQGFAAFDALIGAPGRFVVAQGDLAARGGGRDPFAAPDPAARPTVRADEAEQVLRALWAQALGTASVSLHDNFFELGGNSLVGMQLMNSIGKAFGRSVPVVALFEAPTVSAMAAYLADRGALAASPAAGPGTPPAAAAVPAPVAAAAPAAPPVVTLPAAPVSASAADSTSPASATSAASPASTADTAIAVIGMAGRFPGARDVEEFWEVLREGRETITFFTDEELLAAGVPPEQFNRPDYVRARPVIDGIEDFDAEFFGSNALEARILDPQHRLFLECCWEALERAGHGDCSAPRPVGVFGGANISTYIRRLFADPAVARAVNEYQIVISNDKDALTTNVSYRLNLTGPSFAVQTFCSTSLVAVHLAVRSLLAGECAMALAGGVSVRVPDRTGHVYQEGGMETPDGHVRTFDADARGAIFGDGAAVVLLKPLAAALADGDPIAAVIRGCAINNDGSVKVGYTAPSVRGQSEVVAMALADAGIEPESVSYIEAHGTATPLGDPIEMAALHKVFHRVPRGRVRIGSVKTNLGHLDRAAGATGLIKTVLSLQHRQLPASLHFTRPNPEIDFDAGPFVVNTELIPWASSDGDPRRAGVSSLGMGGTNAHVVLEQAPPPRVAPPGREHQVLVLSGRTAAAVEQAGLRLAEHLRRHPELDPADVAATLQRGRQRFEHRRALVFRELDEAVRLLEAGAASDAPDAGPGPVHAHRDGRRSRRLRFHFGPGTRTGQGAVRALYRAEPVFRAALDEAGDLLAPYFDTAPRDLLLGGGADVSGEPGAARAAEFLLGYAVARLLAGWGLGPDAVEGAGVGELTAACVAGVFSPQDAARLLDRARAPEPDLAGWIARHTPPARPRIGLRNAETGGAHDERTARDAAYWARRLTEDAPCAPSATAAAPADWSEQLLLVLGSDARTGAYADAGEDAAAVYGPLPGTGPSSRLPAAAHDAVAWAWVHGAEPDWEAYQGPGRQRVVLPTYPFQRSRHWIDAVPQAPGEAGRAAARRGPLQRLTTIPVQPADRWLSTLTWRQLGPCAPVGALAGECWLLLADETGLAAALADGLTEHGARVVLAAADDRYRRDAAGSYRLDPADREQWLELLGALDADDLRPTGIAHLRGVGRPSAAGDAAGRVERGFFSVMALLQALGVHGTAASTRRIVVTSDVLDAPGTTGAVDPAKATVIGACRVAPLEYDGVTRHVDVVAPRNRAQAAATARALLAELGADTEPEVALRDGHRWAGTVSALPMPHVPTPETVLRPGGVYLITGGLGGIGLELGRRLVDTVGARLVLVGRAGLPERADWDGLMQAADTPEPVRRRIAAVREIEKTGGEVLAFAADVADAKAMRRVVRLTLERFGRLDGVLHTAGVPGAGVMQLKTRQEAADVLRPKLAAGELVRLLSGHGVDFVALFSSTAYVTGGGPGQADYCAANAALAAEAARAARRPGSADGPRVLAIHWGEWRWNAWDAGIGGFDPTTLRKLRENRERIGIGFDEGWQALLKALHSGRSQVVVSPQDMAELAEVTAGITLAELTGRARSRDGARHPRPELPTAYVEPDGPQEAEVARMWAEVLGLEKVGVLDGFFELGGNSLMGVDLVHRMRAALVCDTLPPHVLYEAPSVREVVAYAADLAASCAGPATRRPPAADLTPAG